MQIAGYLQTSLIEWPGKISSVIFTPGCNFRCPFCHNRDLVNPSRIKGLKEISDESIFKELKNRKKWIDGVAITGGEPTLQPDLDKFLSRLKKMGFETMLETNGSLFPVIDSLLREKLVDFVAMDYKATFDAYERVACGLSLEDSFETLREWADALSRSGGKIYKKPRAKLKGRLVERIKSSMKLILSSGVDFELRTTVVPGIHDEKTLIKMAKELELLTINYQQSANLTWILQNFQPKNCLDPKFNKKKPYTIKELESFLKRVKQVIPGARRRES